MQKESIGERLVRLETEQKNSDGVHKELNENDKEIFKRLGEIEKFQAKLLGIALVGAIVAGGLVSWLFSLIKP